MPDTAQIEKELQQRQGVAKEDTLPPIENKDLQYVPATQQVLYAPPKISFREKYFSPIFRFIRLFIPEIIVSILFILVFVYALNYFNFLPLSTMYPKAFGILPHRYDIEGNKRALSDVAYSSEIEGYEMRGKFISVRGERIIIDHNGKTVEFLKADKISCNSEKINRISDTEEETLSNPTFCSDLLSGKNKDKNAHFTFKRSSEGTNFIDYIAIEE
jgi:hypothetical protein